MARGAPSDHPEPIAAVVRASMDAALAQDALAAVIRYVMSFMAPVGIRVDEILHWFEDGGHPRIAAVVPQGSDAVAVSIASAASLAGDPGLASVEELVGDEVAPARVLDAIAVLSGLGLVSAAHGTLTTHELVDRLVAESSPDNQQDELRTLAVSLAFAVLARHLPDGEFDGRALAHAAVVDLGLEVVEAPFYRGVLLALVNARRLESLGLSWDTVEACRRARRRVAPFLADSDAAAELLRRLDLPRSEVTSLLHLAEATEAEALRWLGDYPGATGLARGLTARASSQGDWVALSRYERLLGAVLAAAGQDADGTEAVERAVAATQPFWTAVLDGLPPPPLPAALDVEGRAYEADDVVDECVLSRLALLATPELPGAAGHTNVAAELAAVHLTPQRRAYLDAALAQSQSGQPSLADKVDEFVADHEAALDDPDRRRRFQTGIALGLALDQAGRYEEALAVMTANHDLAVTLFGPAHPEVALLGRHLGRVLGRTGRHDDARNVLARAAASLGPGVDDATVTRERLMLRVTEAWTEVQRGDPSEAASLASGVLADADIGSLLDRGLLNWLEALADGGAD